MNELVIYAFLCIMLSCTVLAVMLKSILVSAICLAAASASLGVIMYCFGAPWAAVFEVSVCSGLITVIFISGISLSHSTKSEVRSRNSDIRRIRPMPIVLIVCGGLLVLSAVLLKFHIVPEAPVSNDFRDVFWNRRTADIWGQIVVILAGGTAVTVLVKEEKKK